MQQRVKFFGKYALAGFLSVFIVGAVVGYIGESFSLELIKEPLLWLSRGVLIFIAGWSCYLIRVSNQSYERYTREELDEEVYDVIYRQTFRSIEYAQIGCNVAQVLAILNMFIGVTGTSTQTGYQFTFIPFDLGLLFLMTGLQIFLVRVMSKVRQYKMSAFAIPQEVKDYIYSYDEGEKEAVFENSFLTLFQLNQQVLPLTYLVLFALSLITGELQFSAYVVVAFIHIYMNINQFKQVRNYFK